jgi:BAAT / Acyl-CoA thioester hydrolase C terminal./Acyl-CoA thioester hydrolase/BAAT N-terminal region.
MGSTADTTIHCSLHVEPKVTLIDESVNIRLSGLLPGQSVYIRAETQDGALQRWASDATFVADEDGCIDVREQAPVAGTYSGIDGMGLFWSMQPVAIKRPLFFTKTKSTPMTVTFTAEIAGESVVSTSIERIFAAPGVTALPILEHGLVGTLFLPAESGPHPAVIVLNGSDGGVHENAVALLASRGYAALALAYFGVEDVPKELIRIPLEYFERAIQWLQQRAEVQSQNIAVIGLSRGGELALVLGATFPALRAVVAGSPSGIVFGGIKARSSDYSEPSWTYHDEPLPYIGYKQTFLSMLQFFWRWVRHMPFASRAGFLKVLKKSKNVVAATIPVENIQGPVLLLAGQQDQLWPADQFSTWVMERLRAHEHPYPDEYLSYPEAGHFVCFPYGLPSLPPMITLSPVAGMYIAFGGVPATQARAATDSWAKILTFLRDNLSA